MSTVITPILDAVSAPHQALPDEGPPSTRSASPPPEDRSDRVQNDAAALAIRVARLRSEDQALSNVKDAVALTAAAGAFRNSTQILARLKDLALQSTSLDLGAAQRAAIQSEFDALKVELDRLSSLAQSDAASTAAATADTETRAAEAAVTLSNSSHDLILGHTDTSVVAQANQESDTALKLLDQS